MSLTKVSYSMIQGAPVNVLDYGADPTGIADSTPAFSAAQLVSKNLRIPSGTYSLNNYRPLPHVKFSTDGYEATIIKQGTAGNYAINALSDATTGQLLGLDLSGFKAIGATGATIAFMNVEANGVFAVTHSKFDFVAKNIYAPLRTNSPTAGAVYNCIFKVTSDISTAGITTDGTYNQYDFFITNVSNGIYLNDTSTSSLFHKVVAVGQVIFNGQNNVISLLTVESWQGTSQSSVVRISGAQNNFISIRIVSVPTANAPVALDIYGENTTIGELVISGAYPAGAADYPMFLAATSSGRISNVNATGVNRILDSYTSGAILRGWTFEGAMSPTFLNSPTTKNGLYTNVNTSATAGLTVTFGANATTNDWFDAFVLNIAGVLATLTITIPQNPIEGQTARFSSAGAGGVTALTLAPGAGKSVVGAPSGLATGTSFMLVYKAAATIWYRVA